VQNWVKDLKEHADDDVVIMLVGTKLDIVLKNKGRRKVSNEEASMFAQKNNMLFEVSLSVTV
jgi:GTPase SAR1 family protein